MSDTVKLVIEIPKNYLETIKHTVRSTAENGNTPLVFEIIANGIPLDNNSDRAEVQSYFAGMSYGWEQGQKDFAEKIKAEVKGKCDEINYIVSDLPYSKHRAIQELLCEILDNIGKTESEG